VALFSAFRSYSLFKINTLQAVVANYFVCAITGLFFINRENIPQLFNYYSPWLPSAVILGVVLIVAFNQMGITTRKISMTVASIASKMSMVIPVLFAMFIFNIETKNFDMINYSGMILGIGSIVLSSIRTQRSGETGRFRIYYLILPLIVFILSGAVDTIINFANFQYITEKGTRIFPVQAFFVAGVIGAAWLYFKKERFKRRSLIGGIYLGIPNYFSIYFVLKALDAFNNDGALMFPILNISVILLSSLTAMIFFREKLRLVNWIGLILAVVSIYMISYQEIQNYFQE
jgi:multidrug transporter EmrE-like cation transporter